jgi:large subunit ribosomal protein L15
MNLEEAKALGLKGKTRKRVGRGPGSGNGKTAGRGHKGAKARSGWSKRNGWEGGQMPLFRRLPKRGFNNKNFTTNYTIINVGDLAAFEDGAEVSLASVLEKGLVSKEKHTDLFKVLGDGEVKAKLQLRVDAISKSAKEKIEAAGGSVEMIPRKVHRPKFVKKAGNEGKKQAAEPAAAKAAGAASEPTSDGQEN